MQFPSRYLRDQRRRSCRRAYGLLLVSKGKISSWEPERLNSGNGRNPDQILASGTSDLYVSLQVSLSHSQQIGFFCHVELIARSGHPCPHSKKPSNFLSLRMFFSFISLSSSLPGCLCADVLVAGNSHLKPHFPLPLTAVLGTGWPQSFPSLDSRKMEVEWPGLVGSQPSQQDPWVMGCCSENESTRQDTRRRLCESYYHSRHHNSF